MLVEVVTIENSGDVVDVADAGIGAVDLVVSVTAAADLAEAVTELPSVGIVFPALA